MSRKRLRPELATELADDEELAGEITPDVKVDVFESSLNRGTTNCVEERGIYVFLKTRLRKPPARLGL